MGDDRELRFALAMNGGVSLAVWIGGVAYEFSRMVRTDQPADPNGTFRWSDVKRKRRVDVLAGTSAGGMNAGFLAASLLYGTDLRVLRKLWLDRGGLESSPGFQVADGAPLELLRSPTTTSPPSLLDGDYFLDGITAAFESLVPDPPLPLDSKTQLDLRLTTTSFHGHPVDVFDDRGGVFRNTEHAAMFHFRHNLSQRFDFSGSESSASHARIVGRLSRPARSTASYPFAFEPSHPAADEAGTGDDQVLFNATVGAPLVDGGVLDNLPVDGAIEAIFQMLAREPVQRLLVAVVPDPSTDSTSSSLPAEPSVLKIVTASASDIPREQSVARFLDGVRNRSAASQIRRSARRKLLTQPRAAVFAAAKSLWPSYKEQRRSWTASSLNGILEKRQVGFNIDVRKHLPAELPWLPSTWDAPGSGWGSSTVRRLGAVVLDLLGIAQRISEKNKIALEQIRFDVHSILDRAEEISPLVTAAAYTIPATIAERFLKAMAQGFEPGAALTRAINSWPYCDDLAQNEEARLELAWMIDRLAEYMSGLASYLPDDLLGLAPMNDPSWVTDDLTAPLLALAPTGSGPMRTSTGRKLLCAIEVVEGAFGGFDHDPEQEVKLAILTPQHHVAIDPIKDRKTSAMKLAGDDLGHFGAFMKRSWRANDWMWGRLDTVTFLAKEFEVSASERDQLLTEVVKEEAPIICQAIQVDLAAGARSPKGRFLLDKAGPGENWSTIRAKMGGDDQEAARAFLKADRIGEERVVDELWSPLVARVSTRSLAVAAAVLRGAGIPFVQRFVNILLLPLRGLATTANRYLTSVRPNPPSLGRFKAAVATVAVLAGVAFADNLGVNVGVFGPIAWLGLFGALVALVLVAPITSLIGAVFIAGVGSFVALLRVRPSLLDWLPGGDGQRWLTLVQILAVFVIAAALWLMSTRRVERIDRWFRGDPTVDAMEAGLED